MTFCEGLHGEFKAAEDMLVENFLCCQDAQLVRIQWSLVLVMEDATSRELDFT